MVRLLDLSVEQADVLDRLFQIDQSVLEGYLVEEILGWSISRLVCLKDEVVGLIQVRKLDTLVC